MKNETEPPTVVLMEQSPKLRRSKSRDVSSRFQFPTTSFDALTRSPVHTLSPVRRKPESGKTTRPSHQVDDPTASLRGLWPSASASKADTLGDHLGHDRLNDIIERNRARQNASSSRFDHDKESAKENHKPRNPRFSSDLGEACSKAYSKATRRGVEVASKYMSDAAVGRQRRETTVISEPNDVVSAEARAIKRASSMRSTGYGSSKTQWALSPGRSESPRLSAATSSSFSSLKPRSSPSRSSSRGVEKLINLGLDLFKSKKSSSFSFSSSSLSSSYCSSPVLDLNSTPVASYGGGSISETGRDFWLLHNRLMQWRFANARADFVNANVACRVESNLVCAWNCLTKLQHSVAQKRIQLHKEKLDMKLNFILQSHLKLLECWGDMEWRHLAAISNAKESIHSVVCKVPLIEGAKVDIESATMTFRHALDLGYSIKSMLTIFSPSAQKTVELMSELAKVVALEKLLLEECVELLKDISILEIKERSLKCGIISQMEFWKQAQNHKHGQVGIEISS